MENSGEDKLNGTSGESSESANEEEGAGKAELDIFGFAGAGDFFDEMNWPDETFVRNGIGIFGDGWSFGGGGVPSQCGGSSTRIFALAKAGKGLLLLELSFAGFFGSQTPRGGFPAAVCAKSSANVDARHESVPHLITFHI